MSAPDPPVIQIRPRSSNASLTYYFTGAGTGTPASSFGLVYNGPAPQLSNTIAPVWGYTATGLTNGAYYSSSVVAINEYGESTPAFFRTVQPNGFPDPPTNVSASVNAPTSSIRFDWNYPATPQTAQIGWYVVTDSNYTALRSNAIAQYSTINFNVYPGSNHVYYLQSVNDPGYSARTYNSSIIVPYTLAYYPFENSINDTYNVYNMNSNGSLVYDNITYYIGTESLQFDGTTAYTSFNNGFPNMNYWPGFTWMGWVYLTDNTNFRTLFDIGQNTDTYFITHLFNNKMYLAIASNQGGGGYATNLAGPDVNLNTWDHYVFTLGHGAMKIYRNGAYLAETATSQLGISNLAPTTGFFGKSFSAYPYLQGNLDDVGMFNWDLNQNQISYIYNTQVASQTSLSSLVSTVTGLA